MARYYRRKHRDPETYHRNNQPCWSCKKACGGCSWSREFKPVDGWEAIPTKIQNMDSITESFNIKYCPQYEKESRRNG